MSSLPLSQVDQQDRFDDVRHAVLCAVQRFLAENPLSVEHPYIQSVGIAHWPQGQAYLRLKESPHYEIRHIQVRLYVGDLSFFQIMRLKESPLSWGIAVHYINEQGYDIEGCHFSGKGDTLHTDNLRTMLPYRLLHEMSDAQLHTFQSCLITAIEHMLGVQHG